MASCHLAAPGAPSYHRGMLVGLLLLVAYVGLMAFVGLAPGEVVQLTLAAAWVAMLAYPVVWLVAELLR